MTPADPFGLIGQVLDGQFRVDHFVGEGGFSVVYKGHHLGLDEPIAIKCLKLPSALGTALVDSFVKRFRDESRLHYRLSQGNLYIARSIASGTTLAPATRALVPYMVLEWLEGRSLATDLDDRRRQRLRGRTLEETVRLLDSAVDALAYAHAQGVVHRDVNPGNLFLVKVPEGTKLKVLDFGVAKVMSDSTLELGPRAQTLGQIRIFAPAYGAPEQFDDRVGNVGPWTDVYALTLILLEMLRDHAVIEGEHLGDYANATLDPNRRPTPAALGIQVGEEVRKVLERAVALAPAERWRDAGEMWGALKNAMRVEKEVVVSAAARDTPPLNLPSKQPSTPKIPAAPDSTDRHSAIPTQPFHVGPTGTIAFAATPEIPAISRARKEPGPATPTMQFAAPAVPASVQVDTPEAATLGPPTRPEAEALEAPHTLPLGSKFLGLPATSGAPSTESEPQPALPFAATMPDRLEVSGPSPAVPVADPSTTQTVNFDVGATQRSATNTPAPSKSNQANINPFPAPPPVPQVGPLPVPDTRPPANPVFEGRPSGPVDARPSFATDARPSLTAQIPRNRSPLPFILLGVLALALVGLGIFAVVTFTKKPDTPKPTPSASVSTTPSASAATTTTAAPTGTATETATPTSTSTPTPTPTSTPTSTATTTATTTATATTTSTTTSTATSTPIATSTATSTPTVRPTSTPLATDSREFDPVATKAHLDAINGILASCRRPDSRTGRGRIAITFTNDGTTTGATVDPPFAGTKEGDCVAARFRSAKIKPFDGPPRTVLYDFEIPK